MSVFYPNFTQFSKIRFNKLFQGSNTRSTVNCCQALVSKLETYTFITLLLNSKHACIMTFFKMFITCSFLLFTFDMLLPFSHHITAEAVLLKLTLYTVIMTLTEVAGAPTGVSGFGCGEINVTNTLLKLFTSQLKEIEETYCYCVSSCSLNFNILSIDTLVS